ncbi:MAG: cytochrome c [Xanthobacteraceae bacterium]|jgi:cytochrome c
MSSSARLAALIGLCALTFCGVAAEAGSPGAFGYGKPPTAAEIAGWNIDVRGQDGVGLPEGKGTVSHGADVFAAQCAACHGTFGEGEGRYPKLMGGEGTLAGERPEPSVGSYWPFAPTLFDYINRAMPLSAPHTLSADDVYALIAYILNFNNIVPSDFVADRASLPKVKMPNRDNFIWKDPRPDTAAKACMKDCIDPKSVKVMSSAEGRDLTPRTTGPLDKMNGK